MTPGQLIAEWWENASGDTPQAEHAARIDAAIQAERERCAQVALAEQDARIKNANAIRDGDARWGLHTADAESIQNHKAVTAGAIAAAIRKGTQP